jgi:head-tail adaptor
MTLRLGRMRNLVTLQSNTPSQDTIGGTVDSWATFAEWWCELSMVSGGEAFRGRAVHASADTVAVGRYLPEVTAQMRLVHGSRTFDVLSVNNVDERGIELRLALRERRI